MIDSQYEDESPRQFRARVASSEAMNAAIRRMDEATPDRMDGLDPLDALMVPMFMRVCALFKAVLAVVEIGQAHEALLLGRPLFEEALRLKHLSEQNESRRWSYLAHWELMGMQQNIGLFEHESPYSDGRTHAKGAGAQRMASFTSYLASRKIAPRRMAVVETLAREADPHDRWVWLLSQQMVHGNSAAHHFRLSRTAPGEQDYTLGTSDPEELSVAVHWVINSLQAACEAMNRTLGWTSPGDLASEVFSRAEALALRPAATPDADVS